MRSNWLLASDHCQSSCTARKGCNRASVAISDIAEADCSPGSASIAVMDTTIMVRTSFHSATIQWTKRWPELYRLFLPANLRGRVVDFPCVSLTASEEQHAWHAELSQGAYRSAAKQEARSAAARPDRGAEAGDQARTRSSRS